MVRETRNSTILRSHFAITRRPREKEKIDPIPATTTAASPVSRQWKSMKKCVVKIKRLKSPTNSHKNHHVNDASNLGDTMFDPDLVRNSTMVFQTTPCKVRLKRTKLTKTQTPGAEAKDQQTSREPRFFHRDQPPIRTRSSVTRNVYEFLSESQIEDPEEHKDPAEDIIKKMVDDGRACIMTRTRKAGQFRAKPVKKKVRVVGKRRLCSLEDARPAVSIPEKRQPAVSPIYEPKADSTDQQTPSPPISHKVPQIMSPIYELEGDSNDQGTFLPPVTPISQKAPQAMSPIYELDANSSEEDEPNPIQVLAQVHVPSSEIHQSVTEPSAYSHLARSVILNQTQSHNNLTSPSKRRQQLDLVRQYISTPINGKNGKAVTTTISPIPTQAAGKVVSSAGGGSSPWRVSQESSLPNTFRFGLNTSYLPSFSSDHQPKRHVYIPDENCQRALSSDCPTQEEIRNNSNGENMPPVATPEGNENVENIVHLPNPRRTLQNRMPLKDINILEVVHLPSWKKNPLSQATPSKDESDLRDAISPMTQKSNSSQSRRESRNLFGFEEFLDPNEHSQREVQATALNQDQTLNDKLQRMKRLRPVDRDFPQVASTPLRYGYDNQLQQRNIRQMLCSTMIAPVFQPPPRNIDDSVGLFSETQPDPEASFDHKKPRRTYVQERPKRKRKQRVKVVFIDTDSSENDDDEEDSLESPQKSDKKRSRKDAEHEANLKEFVTSFNKQCEEVEKFPVIIE
ncbi:protein dalmatian [Drosophila tropicalis]|uniref:protein dalmatian n=1 Tax=Drosophila tropicalis TaxID=46794 RepID=UPI0035AC0221